MTPSGNGKSVTVTNCHCKQSCFITKFLVWELPIVSLYPVVTVCSVTVTDWARTALSYLQDTASGHVANEIFDLREGGARQ